VFVKTAKIHRILFFAALFLMSLVFAFALMNKPIAKADISKDNNVSTYFSYNDKVSGASFSDDSVKFSVVKDADIKLRNNLVVDNFGIGLTLADEIKEITVTLSADSRLYNGNKNSEGKFDTEIKNVLTLNKNGTVTFNGETGSATVGSDIEIFFTVQNGTLKATVGGVSLTSADSYYLLNTDDAVDAEISFGVTDLEGEDAVDFKINYFDQNVGVDGFKQTFEVNAEDKIESALPRVKINSSEFFNVVSGVNQVRRFYTYSISGYKFYSVFGGEDSGDYYLSAASGDITVNGSTNRDVTFYDADGSSATLAVCYLDESTDPATEIQIATYTVNVNEDGTTAPVYKTGADFDAAALESFKAKLEDALYTDDAHTEYVAIGSGKSVTIPTMQDLVSDDITSYSSLKKTVQYWTPTTNSTSTSMSVPVATAGHYRFCVLFEDAAGNKMENEDFYSVDDDNSDVFTVDGIYSQYFFEFDILDNAEMSVVAATQSNGFVGVKFKASSFTITASSYNTTYSLYYSVNDIDTEDDGWIEIIPVSKASEADDNTDGGYTYDEIVAIGYDGQLTFTPDKVGYYKIDCRVSSTSSARSVEAATKITVQAQPEVVTPDNHWAENNIASIIFLSIGSLSLIGIIVLIFVKPKDEDAPTSKKK